MALIIENGTNVANANSYVDLAECRTYATSRGLSVSTDDAILEQYLIRAKDYLETYRDQYQGYKTNDTQSLQFPRTGVYIDCILIADTTIPQELKDAQCQLAVDQTSGIELFPVQEGKFVITEQIAPLKVQYSDSINTTGQPYLTTVQNLLKPLLKSGSALGDIRSTLRV